MERDDPPRGKWEYIFLALIVLVIGLTVRIYLDPNASLTMSQYVDIAQWVLETLEGILDPGGPI